MHPTMYSAAGAATRIRKFPNLRRAAGAVMLLAFAASAQAAFLLEIDTDGADDGVVTYNPGFSFGGDTTTASQSITSTAYGTTGGDSIFGGNGVNLPDTYLYTYTPSSDADNLVIPGGIDLGGGNLATGLTGGGAGIYRVYATWPLTQNVSGGLTRYTISTAGAADVVVDIDQNFAGSSWIFVGDIEYSDLTASISVSQMPTLQNSFVSMRSYGLLFELVQAAEEVPAPAPLVLLLMGVAGWRMCMPRRRRTA